MFELKSFIFEMPSKSLLVGMGFPEVVASIFIEKFDNKAFLLARWFKEYSGGKDENKWWRLAFKLFPYGKMNIYGLVEAYEALERSSFEEYHKIRQEYGMESSSYNPENYKTQNLEKLKSLYKEEIEKNLTEDPFFNRSLIKGILNGSITDLKPYKDLEFREAQDKLDKKSLFKDPGKVVKRYENGWRWIDGGAKCDLIGKQMKNCGSAGLMSTDDFRTLMVLFNNKNQAKAIVTYSPTQNRLSSAEGQASTELKDVYHDYILDLERVLGAEYDFIKSDRSKLLNMKSMLKNKLASVERIGRNTYNEIFKITLTDGTSYYTDSFDAAPAEEIENLFETQTLDNSMFDFVIRALGRYSDFPIKKIGLSNLR